MKIITPVSVNRILPERELAGLYFNFLKMPTDSSVPEIQIIKDVATGKAARWHGYNALEGLGITRMRNHIREAKPVTQKTISTGRFFLVFISFYLGSKITTINDRFSLTGLNLLC
jgi:hypothetical protein